MTTLPARVSPQRMPVPSARGMDAALSLSAAEDMDWKALTAVVLGEPAWLLQLFSARPLNSEIPCSDLESTVAERLQALGRELLELWLWRALPVAAPEPPPGVLATAGLARQLALDTAYPYPDEAFLAGLWHGLGNFLAGPEAPPPPEQWPTDGITSLAGDHASIASRLAEACGLPGTVADALLIHHVLVEQLAGAHPLARLLHAAERLGSGELQLTDLAQLAELLRLAPERLSAHYAAHRPAPGDTPALPAPQSDNAPPAWVLSLRRTACQGLLRSAFEELDAATTLARLQLAARLLHGQQLILFAHAEDDTLRAAPLGEPDRLAARFDQLALGADDPVSVLALALSSDAPARLRAAPGVRNRSAADWHLVRWSGAPGLLCIPDRAHTSVAVFAYDETREAAASDELGALVGRAALRLSQLRERAQAQRRSADETAQRYREHARRLAHEAGNPISIMRTYLALIADTHPEDATLQQQMQLIDQEVERINGLVRRLGETPKEQTEAPWCQAAEILKEMQKLHAEVLFARRGIQFDLRLHAQLPAVALPASVLKQVLLNLFRNASEALHPGGRFAASSSGVLSLDGRPCLELRLVDNGPGLPPERLAALFSAEPSRKGGEHAGVGLAIVRELLAAWQANIICRSQAGSGTSFQLFLPLHKAPPQAAT